jgi:hypothetical protein
LSQQRIQALLVGFGEILEQPGLALQRHLHQPGRQFLSLRREFGDRGAATRRKP